MKISDTMHGFMYKISNQNKLIRIGLRGRERKKAWRQLLKQSKLTCFFLVKIEMQTLTVE